MNQCLIGSSMECRFAFVCVILSKKQFQSCVSFVGVVWFAYFGLFEKQSTVNGVYDMCIYTRM